MASFEMDGLPSLDYLSWRAAFMRGFDGVDNVNPSFHLFDKYFPYCCVICKRGSLTNHPTLRCGGCKLVLYCSKQHQKKHWNKHKSKCRKISVYCQACRSGVHPLIVPPYNRMTWKWYVSTGMSKSDLIDTSRDQWMLQSHCQVCFDSPVFSGQELNPCNLCFNTGYCSSSQQCIDQFHDKHSIQSCERNLVAFACIGMSMQQGTILLGNCETRDSSCDLPQNWTEYFRTKRDDFTNSDLFFLPPVVAMITDGLSRWMTILMNLQRLYPDNLYDMNTIEIHILGPEFTETLSIKTMEELFHWLPRLKRLNIVLVGPNNEILPKSSYCELCPCCISAGCSVSVVDYIDHYHTLVESCKIDPSTATIIAAFHSGVHERIKVLNPILSLYDAWQPTIEILRGYDVPIIFTGYTSEVIDDDNSTLVQLGMTIIIEPYLNSYRGLRPFVDNTNNEIFYFTNYYCLVARGVGSSVV